MKHFLIQASFLSGILYTTPGSAQRFDNVFNVPGNNIVYCLAANSSYVYAGTGGSGLYRSSDNGLTWNSCNNGTPGGYFFSLSASYDSLYAGSFGEVYFSQNNGDSWSGKGLNLGLNDNVLTISKNTQYVFAGVKQKGVYRTGLGSGSWSAKNTGLHSSPTIHDLLYSGGFLFAATDLGVYRSANNANSWQPLNSCPGVRINQLFVYHNAIFAATASGIYRSTDLGLNWSNTSSGIPPGTEMLCLTALNNTMIAGASTNSASGAFLSSDQSATWKPYTASGAACCPFNELVTFNEFVFSGNAGTINRYSQTPVSVPLHGQDYFLFSVYPNPASAAITLETPGAGKVGTYRIYSFEGKEILSGNTTGQKTELKLETLEKGIYLLRFESEDKIETKKIIKN